MNALDPNQIITHKGARYNLDNLAHYMDDEQREYIHSRPDWMNGNAQHFWDAFCQEYPADAEHLARITPPIFD